MNKNLQKQPSRDERCDIGNQFLVKRNEPQKKEYLQKVYLQNERFLLLLNMRLNTSPLGNKICAFRSFIPPEALRLATLLAFGS